MDIPRLHPDTIDAVKERADIVDVISERVVLRKRGKDHLGLCPFHDEKTPSFSVSPEKQLYYCFGCGAGGNAIKFLMETGQQSFTDVVLDLARRYQIPVKTLEPEQRQALQRELSQREQLYEILAVTTSFFQHALRQPQGAQALEYLQQKRGLSEATLQQFKLGYAPAGWETLYRYLVEQKRYSAAVVAEAGLIKVRQSGDGYYDQFRDRVAIPICDAQGRVIGFGTRTLGSDEPKYLNSPETPLFDKSKTLFALDHAKEGIRKQDGAIIVEGYFDAIALHSAGITNAVASLGTALTKAQLRKLLRYTDSKRIIFNFDADKAGVKATQRAIGEVESLVYSGQVQLRILNLPGGKDADEFLRSQPEAVNQYQAAVTGAPLWIDWQIDQLLLDQNLKQADQFEAVSKSMVSLLRRLEDANKRTHYVRYCSERLSQGDARLVPLYVDTLLGQLTSTRRSSQSRSSQSRSSQKRQQTVVESYSITTVQKAETGDRRLLEEAEALLLLNYLHCPLYREAVVTALEDKDLLFRLPHHRFLWQQINQFEADSGQQSQQTNAQVENRLLSHLLTASSTFPENLPPFTPLFHLTEKTSRDIMRVSIRIPEAIAALERVNAEQYLNHCLKQWQQSSVEKNDEQMRYYFREIQAAKQTIQVLDQQRLSKRT